MGNERLNWNMAYWLKIKLVLQQQWWDCSNQMLSLKTDVTLQKPVMKHKAGRAPHMSQIMSKTLWKTPSSSFPSKCTTLQVIDSLKKKRLHGFWVNFILQKMYWREGNLMMTRSLNFDQWLLMSEFGTVEPAMINDGSRGISLSAQIIKTAAYR